MSPFWPTQSYAPLPSLGVSGYTPQFKSNTPMGGIISSLGKYLTPAKQFTKVMPYETYAAPQQEAFNLWESTMFRPEFEKTVLNPFKRQYANTAATTGLSLLGRAPRIYQEQLQSTQRPYYDQLEQARGSWADMMRRSWEQAMMDYYESPTTWSKIGL